MKWKFVLSCLAVVFAASVMMGDEEDEAFKDVPQGTVVNVKGAHAKRLHFCVFENGEEDYAYVGVNYGMWQDGEFDLSIDDKVVFTGKVPHLLYEGAIIQMGDVLKNRKNSNIGIEISRIKGMFK